MNMEYAARTETRRRISAIWAYRRIISLIMATITLFASYALWVQARTDARWDRGSSAVGALFLHAFGVAVDAPFCTASIVSSHKGNLLITAAHCLGRFPVTDIVFVPFYHDGIRPFGSWKVTSEISAPSWLPGGQPNEDFAFLTVNGNVQERAGAERLGVNSPVPARVTIEGYSLAGGMAVCTRKPTTIEVESHQQQLKVRCGGLLNGSSGGPFLTHISKRSGLGTVVGIIGGYQQGGSTPDISYSSPFNSTVISLYNAILKKNL
jgi:hypothetical protein